MTSGGLPGRGSGHTALVAANSVGVLAAGAFAVVGALKPHFDTPDLRPTPLAQFWALSSAVRTLSLATPLLVALARRDDRSTATLLRVAGWIQLGDAALGIWQRNPGMTTAPPLVAALHLASARVLSSGHLADLRRPLRPR